MRQSIIQFLLFAGVLLFANLAVSFVYWDIDLTEDKRYTLTDATYKLLDNLEDVVTIEIYLEGEFPASIKHLQNSTRELLEKFRSRNPLIEYRFVNPLEGDSVANTPAAQKQLFEAYKKRGINPVGITVNTKGTREQKVLFPAAAIRYKNTERVVSLLHEIGGVNQDYTRMENINLSVNLLEYKFANAIQKIGRIARPRVALLTGHGEIDRPFSEGLEKSLYEYYDIARINLDSTYGVDTLIDVLMILKPQTSLGEKHQFMIDQYLMNGGKIIWALDMVNVEQDTLMKAGICFPMDRTLDIGSQLFDYGARVNANVIEDLKCSKIPVVKGGTPEKPQLELLDWVYHPTVYPYKTALEREQSGSSLIEHPIVQNIDYVDSRYPSSIDTVQTKGRVKATPLLRGSRYSKLRRLPFEISLESIKNNLTQAYFEESAKKNKNYPLVAVLLEGEFVSFFRNRVSPEMKANFERAGRPIRDQSRPTKQIVISDGDIARNEMVYRTGQIMPLGMNKYEGYQYGNRDFMMNCVEYMIDNEGIIAARAKEVKLRPLDQERGFTEESFWQFINLGLPLLVTIVSGILYTIWRRKRYAW